MKKEGKMCLSEIKVQSFSTSLEKKEQKTINAGGTSEPNNCRKTSIPVLC